MKIKKLVLLAIRGSSETRKRLKEALDITEPTLYRLLSQNDDDLTKAAALKVIREELNLTDEDILEEESEVKEAVK